MFPPFDEEPAAEICRKMIEDLDTGRLVLEQVTAVSEERAGNGLMLGALLARDSDGNKVVLKTISGLSRNLREAADAEEPSRLHAGHGESRFSDGSVIVPPLVSAAERDSALEANDAEIHALTRRIEALAAATAQHAATEDKAGTTALAEPAAAPDAKEEPCCGESKKLEAERKQLEAERAALCRESLAKVYQLYAFHCADGVLRSLNSICKERNISLPPTGTGDCCAPKLLDYAFSHQLQPVSMCEMYYGKPTANKMSGQSYPPCDERCGILLPAMLGLEILYRDEHIIVVNKQSGLLSVPGKIEKDCIVNRVRRLFPHCIEQPAVHRLDMETSGLLVLAFTKEAHRALNRQFEEGSVQKQYVALLDGVLAARGIPAHGTSELYFRVDIENRPHQIWDEVYGKKAVTEWQIIRTETYYAPGEQKSVPGAGRPATRVLFTPHTGRTHQLRLASADSHGFGIPIIGDTLYGTCEPGERLMLHAQSLSFTHPATGERMEFYCKAPF